MAIGVNKQETKLDKAKEFEVMEEMKAALKDKFEYYSRGLRDDCKVAALAANAYAQLVQAQLALEN